MKINKTNLLWGRTNLLGSCRIQVHFKIIDNNNNQSNQLHAYGNKEKKVINTAVKGLTQDNQKLQSLKSI